MRVCYVRHVIRVRVCRRVQVCVKALVRWATGKRLTNRLPKLSLITWGPHVRAAGRVRSKEKRIGIKKHEKICHTQNKPRNPQQPGDRDQRETARDIIRHPR